MRCPARLLVSCEPIAFPLTQRVEPVEPDPASRDADLGQLRAAGVDVKTGMQWVHVRVSHRVEQRCRALLPL